MTDEKRNFQKSTLKIRCPGCHDECNLVYDHHHDQTFSLTCGRVIMQSNIMLINYTTDPLFWEKQKQRREQIQQLNRIISKLKEWEKPYTTTEDLEIHIPELTPAEQSTIQNLCTDTDFKLILEKKYTPQGKYLGATYIIKKKDQKEKETK